MNKLPDTSGKPRRNQPCPCGSGIKTKRCCSDPVKIAAKFAHQKAAAQAEHEKRLAAYREEIRQEKYIRRPSRLGMSGICLIAAAMSLGIPAGRTLH